VILETFVNWFEIFHSIVFIRWINLGVLVKLKSYVSFFVLCLKKKSVKFKIEAYYCILTAKNKPFFSHLVEASLYGSDQISDQGMDHLTRRLWPSPKNSETTYPSSNMYNASSYEDFYFRIWFCEYSLKIEFPTLYNAH
jgi:hypothetical protein